MSGFDRRRFLQLAGLGAVGSAVLAGCGGGGSGASGSTTLRYAWWGNNIRQQNYTEAFEAFQDENPDISIDTEFASYNSFLERMTTQMAARNVPEIFWIGSAQVMTYHKSNLFRPLADLPTLDLSDYTEEDLTSFELAGELNTLPHGAFVPVVRYNETFVERDGVDLPEGDEWTWENLSDLLIDYAGDDRRGILYEADHDITFEGWLRQHGQQLWTEDGQPGFDAEGAGAWFEWWDELRRAGATMSLSEQEGMTPDWADVGDRVLMKVGNSNHIIDEAALFPDDTYRLRALPVASDAVEGHKFVYYPRLAVYQGADDSTLEAAGTLINYTVGNAEFLQTVGMTMGAPPNPRLLQEAYEFATPDEEEMLAVVEGEMAADRAPRFEAPAGSSTWRTAFTRAAEEIALERNSISAASEAMVADIISGIEREG